MHYSDNELLVWSFTGNSMQFPSNPPKPKHGYIPHKNSTPQKKHCPNYKHRIINHCLLLKIIRTTYPALFNVKGRYIHITTVLNNM